MLHYYQTCLLQLHRNTEWLLCVAKKKKKHVLQSENQLCAKSLLSHSFLAHFQHTKFLDTLSKTLEKIHNFFVNCLNETLVCPSTMKNRKENNNNIKKLQNIFIVWSKINEASLTEHFHMKVSHMSLKYFTALLNFLLLAIVHWIFCNIWDSMSNMPLM